MKKIIKALSAIAAVVIVAGGLVVASGAQSAEAHTPNLSANCQGWTANYTAYGTNPQYQITVVADGQTVVPTTPIRDRYTPGLQAWPSLSETHTVSATVTRADGRTDSYTGTRTASAQGCEAPAVVTPQIQDYLANCDARFVLDNTGSNRSVVYTINGTAYTVTAGTAMHVGPIPMNASFGYEITTDSGRAWLFAHTSEQLDACAGPKPSERVQYIYSQWSDDGVCETPGQATVQQSQSVTVRTTTYVREGLVWVPVTTDEFLTTKTRERDLTHEERVACAGSQPPADEASSTSEWMGGVFECGDETVTEERTVTTTRVEYLLNDDYVWVAGEEQTTVTTETQTRPLTDDERADQAEACTVVPPVIPPTQTPEPTPPAEDCPADAPIRVEDDSCAPEEFFSTPSAPAPSPVATPENRSAPATLPQTGAEDYAGPLTIFAVFLVLTAGGFFVADYRKRKANGEHVDAD